jgi:hypothetical protein
MSAYSKAELERIRKVALKIVPGAKSVSHIHPRAYCIAKPAACCAVFVVPEIDSVPLLQKTPNASSDIVRDNVSEVRVGDWCILAYISSELGGGMAVIENLTQGIKKGKPCWEQRKKKVKGVHCG